MNATLAVLVVVAVLVVAVLAMSLRRAQSRVYQARAETAQTQRQLERLQSEASSLRAGQMTIGAVATDALLTLDAERRVTWANQVALKLFGEPVGKTLIEATRSHELEVFMAQAPSSVEPLTRQVVLNGQPFLFRPRPARPPIFVGGAPPHALRRTVRFGDGWMPIGADPEQLRAPIDELRAAAARAEKPRPEVIVLTALPLDDPPRAVDRVRAFAAVGATRVVHGWRYPDAAAFARAAETMARRIRPELST